MVWPVAHLNIMEGPRPTPKEVLAPRSGLAPATPTMNHSEDASFLTIATDRIDASDAMPARTGTQFGGSDARDAAHELPCDFCGAARARSERHRFVWDTGLGTELVLAELCSRCAGEADRLLEMYGGRGRDAIRLTQGHRVSAQEAPPVRTIRGIVIRGLVYVSIALAAFVVVTFVTSRG
jgi:hypothetical protein